MRTDGRKLFIGNLNYRVTEDELRAFFVDAGYQPTKVTIPLDKETQNARGFGFVELETPEDAQRAIGDLHQQVLEGRSLHIDLAQDTPRPQQDRPGGLRPPRDRRW